MVARASSGVTSWAIVEGPGIDVAASHRLAGRFEILAGVVPADRGPDFFGPGLFDDLCVTFQLVADCRSNDNRYGSSRSFLHH